MSIDDEINEELSKRDCENRLKNLFGEKGKLKEYLCLGTNVNCDYQYSDGSNHYCTNHLYKDFDKIK